MFRSLNTVLCSSTILPIGFTYSDPYISAFPYTQVIATWGLPEGCLNSLDWTTGLWFSTMLY